MSSNNFSYASAAKRAVDDGQPDPLPDTGLLNTTRPSANPVVDDTAKVTIVPSDYKSNPVTATSANAPSQDLDSPPNKKRPNRQHHKVEDEGYYFWDVAKDYLLRPGVAGGIIGIVNVGLLAGAARAFYTQPHLRRDSKAISSAVAATIALLSMEGFAVEKYSKTPRGQEEARRAKEDGSLIYRNLREQILRPDVLGGILGIVNAGILGAVGYFSYINWDKPTWDRRVVSAVSIGVLALWSGEGVLAEGIRSSKRQ
ncbi:uncharacterized protein EV420DRAFT_196480 [Desarmillaria tabescens]|uniref:Uncharacterized protein n=1 Tax=Armillaria tabescens TaxID=1929756 RepID=A0AA39N9A3_ARMTA|nr:uncharacterized protein EV420DRAFT_196480 [Desarmillaria tabescens]KAK0461390.1 hypothetical protein EV420DRAFT_196480 [Desarmillaria tabescens]